MVLMEEGEADVMVTEDYDFTYLQQILESKYEKQDLHEVAMAQTHLSPEEQARLEELLIGFESSFDGTLGKWKDMEVMAEINPNVQPYHCKCPI